LEDKKNILHVITVSFSIPIFFKNQFDYFEDKQNVFVACKNSSYLKQYSRTYKFTPIILNIERRITPIKDLICIVQLCRQIRKNKIDVVVGHTPKGALLAMIASFLTRTPKRIYFKHGLVFETQKGYKKFFFIQLERITEFFSSDIILVSNSLLNTSKLYALGDPNKYKLLNKGTCNGIDSSIEFNPDLIQLTQKKELKTKYKISEELIVVGFIGRLSNDKGINELISAWNLIESKYNNVVLMLIGPIDERDPFDIKIIKNCKNIIYIDFVSNPAIYYSIFDIFILPSYREGFPTVNLEASSMKLPVITTRKTGCIDSIINSITGIYTDINPQSIANSIEYYLTNPELLKVHGENGRKFVLNNFNQIVVWDSLSKIYFN
jgi:glycosyltransferase involved in cell wall biosynthesis